MRELKCLEDRWKVGFVFKHIQYESTCTGEKIFKPSYDLRTNCGIVSTNIEI